jgi:hypothetical protein
VVERHVNVSEAAAAVVVVVVVAVVVMGRKSEEAKKTRGKTQPQEIKDMDLTCEGRRRRSGALELCRTKGASKGEADKCNVVCREHLEESSCT